MVPKAPGLAVPSVPNPHAPLIVDNHVRFAAGNTTGATTSTIVDAAANCNSTRRSTGAGVDAYSLGDHVVLSMSGVYTEKQHRENPSEELHGEGRVRL